MERIKKILYYNIENMNEQENMNQQENMNRQENMNQQENINQQENFRGHFDHNKKHFRNNHISINYLILFLAIFMFFTALMILLLRKI